MVAVVTGLLRVTVSLPDAPFAGVVMVKLRSTGMVCAVGEDIVNTRCRVTPVADELLKVTPS